MDEELTNRIAVLARLVECTPGSNVGRTAIMKLAYFLTALRGVPLGYRFTLYSYGPFDSAVLHDVDFASTLGALSTQPVRYPNGYGYSIQPGEAIEEVKALAHDFLQAHEADIEWVAQEFGNLTAAELELASTIIYMNQEPFGSPIDQEELARRVHDVKPHFSEVRILSRIGDLRTKELLAGVHD